MENIDTNKNSKDKLSPSQRAQHQRELRQRHEAIRRANKHGLMDKMKDSPYLILRVIYKIVYSVWLVAVAIGGFIAWLIAFLFI